MRYYGGSLILKYKEFFVFGVKTDILLSQKKIVLTGIGGKRETGESFIECAIRECKEEIGINPDLTDVDSTVCIINGNVVTTSPKEKSLACIVERQAPGSDIPLTIYIYAATIPVKPQIIDDEFQHLLLLNKSCIDYWKSNKAITGRQALSLGAEFIPNEGADCFLDYEISFTDSPEIYMPVLF